MGSSPISSSRTWPGPQRPEPRLVTLRQVIGSQGEEQAAGETSSTVKRAVPTGGAGWLQINP